MPSLPLPDPPSHYLQILLFPDWQIRALIETLVLLATDSFRTDAFSTATSIQSSHLYMNNVPDCLQMRPNYAC